MDANVLVIDSSDIASLKSVKAILEILIKTKPLRDKPLMVWANKKDISQNMYGKIMTDLLSLRVTSTAVVDIVCDLLNRHKDPFADWYIQSSCGTTGDGLCDGLDWLVDAIKEKGSPR